MRAAGTNNGWGEIRVNALLRRLPALLLALLFLIVIICDGGATWLWGRLGFRIHKYDREKKTADLAVDCTTATDLCAILSLLDTSGGVPTIRTPMDAVKSSRDRILSMTFSQKPAYYMGNADLLAAVEKAYPGRNYFVFIPQADFEQVVYAAFGGRYRVNHTGGSIWKYLPAVDGYTTLYTSSVSDNGLTITSLWEGEGAYHATVRDGENLYSALFVKREDGSAYLSYLIRL